MLAERVPADGEREGREMDERVRTFLERNHAAIMVTTKPDGIAHVARVGVGLVDGQLESSGTRGRVRTEHLRRDRIRVDVELPGEQVKAQPQVPLIHIRGEHDGRAGGRYRFCVQLP